MLGRFGSREICDVTFKALTDGMQVGTATFNAGQPVFVIDTATTSSMEQATTTVYAQGGKGNNRLMSWEGEKTMTFNVTDALMSPLGLHVLTGAGFADASETALQHIHVTMDKKVSKVTKSGSSTTTVGQAKITLKELVEELGLPGTTSEVRICVDEGIKTYATVLDNNGAIVDWVQSVTVDSAVANDTTGSGQKDVIFEVDAKYEAKTLKFDFYVVMKDNCSKISIKPEDFGGYFYVEADTLYRNQDGKDMATTLTFPKVKIQSGFTISMAATGDPSTFDFVMDAFPGYTWFDTTKKVVCDITLVGGATDTSKTSAGHKGDHTTADATVTTAKSTS